MTEAEFKKIFSDFMESLERAVPDRCGPEFWRRASIELDKLAAEAEAKRLKSIVDAVNAAPVRNVNDPAGYGVVEFTI